MKNLLFYLLFCFSCFAMDESRGIKRTPTALVIDSSLQEVKRLQPTIVEALASSSSTKIQLDSVPRILSIMRAAIRGEPVRKIPQYNPSLSVKDSILDFLASRRKKYKHKIDVEVARLQPEPLQCSVFHVPSAPSDEPLPLSTVCVIDELKQKVPRLQTVQFVTTKSTSVGFASSSNTISLNPGLLLPSFNSQGFVILHENGHLERNDPQEGWEHEKKLGKYAATNVYLHRLMRLHEVSADFFALSQGSEICKGCIEFTNDAIKRNTSDTFQSTPTHPCMRYRKEIACGLLALYECGILT